MVMYVQSLDLCKDISLHRCDTALSNRRLNIPGLFALLSSLVPYCISVGFSKHVRFQHAFSASILLAPSPHIRNLQHALDQLSLLRPSLPHECSHHVQPVRHTSTAPQFPVLNPSFLFPARLRVLRLEHGEQHLGSGGAFGGQESGGEGDEDAGADD